MADQIRSSSGDRPLADDVAGVERGRRLDEDDPALLLGRGLVLDALRHDEELALGKLDVAGAQAHAHPSLDDQEELVLVLVVMPDEVALELDDLDLVVVQVADDLGLPVVREERELLEQVDLVHGHSPLRRRRILRILRRPRMPRGACREVTSSRLRNPEQPEQARHLPPENTRDRQPAVPDRRRPAPGGSAGGGRSG